MAQAAAPNDEALFDPTTPLNYAVESEASAGFFLDGLPTPLSSYKLTSVLIRSGDRIAIINDQRVRVGDSIGEAKVISIDSNSATIDVDAETKVLQLYTNTVRTLVAGEGK